MLKLNNKWRNALILAVLLGICGFMIAGATLMWQIIPAILFGFGLGYFTTPEK